MSKTKEKKGLKNGAKKEQLEASIAKADELTSRAEAALEATIEPGYSVKGMAATVGQASQIADHYRQMAAVLTASMLRALYFLKNEPPEGANRIEHAINALMVPFGWEEPLPWKNHWVYNHTRPSGVAILDTLNATFLSAVQKGGVPDVVGLPDQFYRYAYEAVCELHKQPVEEDTPESIVYMGVTLKPMSVVERDYASQIAATKAEAASASEAQGA